ncbi:MAG: adenosylcobinamide-GDP ribazoletransferase [Gammaproteobacteria bacterium]|nr:adenosylcobinamide-GDP ribazoletransferase [Gammaproteobacteria bacterium]
MHPFLIALQFLTRIPVISSREWTDENTARSVLYYPLVGLLIGLVIVLLQWLLAGQPVMLVAAVVLVAWVVITGGLHLDGLADSADAWAGGYGDRARSLEIMKDPRSGPLAVVVLVLTLLLKFAALSVLLGQHWSLLLVVPVVARSAVIALFLSTEYVRVNGLGSAMSQHLPKQVAVIVLIGVVLCCLLLLGLFHFVALALTSLLVFYFLRLLMLKRLGGMTGDTAGALIEIMEAALLIMLAL